MLLNKKNQKGFTLTELIVVIVIIAILAGVMLPTLTSYIARANKSADEQKVAGINTLLYEAQITEMEFEDALELKDYLENDMDYDGDYSLKLKGSYMWYDSKEGKVVIITEDDDAKLQKLATAEKAEFVTAGNLKSPEGLMQYSDGTEVWLIGGNGYLVEVVEEIRNIGDNGAGELEEYKNLDAEKKAIFNSFFGSYVFSGTKGTFKVDLNGVITEASGTDMVGKEAIQANNKVNLAELFHKEVIEANITKINAQLIADSAPVRLTLDGYNVKITITDSSGLSKAAASVYEIIKLLIDNDCELGYVIPKQFNTVKEYEEVLAKIAAGYNAYEANSESNTIKENLYTKLNGVFASTSEIDVNDLEQFYKVNLSQFSSSDNIDINQLMSILPSLIVALNLKETTENNVAIYDLEDLGNNIGVSLFENKQPIRLIGVIDSEKYGRLNAQYDFEFEVLATAAE